MSTTPTFPLSDHCDGAVFFNPGAGAVQGQGQGPGQVAASGLLPILRWRLSGTRSRWPARVIDPAPVGDPRSEPPAGGVSVTFIGHATFLLRMGGAPGEGPRDGGLTILTDPMFSERASPVSWAGPKRVRAPGRAFGALPRVDLVLLSHNHYDHLDLPSVREIVARDDPWFVTPLGNARLLAAAGARRVIELDWWEAHRMPDGTLITATPARHFAARTAFDRNQALWSGFMVGPAGGGAAPAVLFAGDSGAGPHWEAIRQRLGAPGLALLPIGAYDPRRLMAAVHMDPSEAVAAHLALGAGRSIGMHFGTIQLTDEPIGEPEARLQAAAAAAGLAADAFTTLGFGEMRDVVFEATEGGPDR